MLNRCSVNEIRVGDVIDGPDGRSTVVGIRNDPGTDMLSFSFAEGKGNRGWSGLIPTEKITRLERTYLDTPLGFVVDDDNQVVLDGVFEVVDKGKSIEVHHYINTTGGGGITSFHKKGVNRIMGKFVYTLNPAR